MVRAELPEPDPEKPGSHALFSGRVGRLGSRRSGILNMIWCLEKRRTPLQHSQADSKPGPCSVGSTLRIPTDGALVRRCLRRCAKRSWDLGKLDIRTAFLLAPLLYREARQTIAHAPQVFNIAHICEEKKWRVDRAMYGLRTSPRSRSTYRDTTMRSTRGRFRGKIICFRQSRSDESLWHIALLPNKGTEGGSRMFMEKWRCSEPQRASATGEVKFQ